MITLRSNRLFRPFVSSIKFSASFGTPTIGQFDFGRAGNTGVVVCEIQPKTVYFVDSMEIAANITPEAYLSAISVLPFLKFRRSQSGEIVYGQQIPVGMLSPTKPLSGFVVSPKSGENLIADLTGIFNMIDDLIGINPLIITVGINIYAIDEVNYNREFGGR